jgi:chemosensory pili system protein ChpE
MLALFLIAIGGGLAFCAPPGAVTAETIRRGARGGFRAALWVQLGSLIGDSAWCALALTGLAFLAQNPPVRYGVGMVGLGLLLYLAGSAMREAWRGGALTTKAAHANRNDFSTGVAMSLSNPMNIVFWLGMGTSLLTSYVAAPQWAHYVTFFSGFMLGAALWACVMAGAVAVARHWLTPRLFRAINLLCGLALLYFAFVTTQTLWGR